MPFRRRRSSSRRGTSRPIRNREWVPWTTVESAGYTYEEPRPVVLYPGQALRSWIITPGEAQSFWDEPTIVRHLFTPQVFVNGTTAQVQAAYRQTLRGGFITWKHGLTQATGPTDFDGLDPSDGALDWMWWGTFPLHHFSGMNFETVVYDFTGQGGFLESKTKRKLEMGYGLAMAFYNLPDSTPIDVGMDVFFCGRILLLNH